MITKENLAKFIKGAIKEAPFDGCMYVDLDCTDEDSRELYLVFASDGEGNASCKVAYNCDDLQCDYDWDWIKPDEIDCEYDDCQAWPDSLAEEVAEWIVGCLLAGEGE